MQHYILSSNLFISLLVFIPDSETNKMSLLTAFLKFIELLISTVKSFKFLLFTPNTLAPEAIAIFISSKSCASTNTPKPIEWAKLI